MRETIDHLLSSPLYSYNVTDVSPRSVVLWFVPRPTSQETKTKVHETRTRVGEQPDANQIRLLLGWPRERHESWGVRGWSKCLIAATLVETPTAALSTVAPCTLTT